jgi:cysteine synthase
VGGDVLDGIGATPVVGLAHLAEPGMAEVWVKHESANPTGSYKDRMALGMIEGGERGELGPGKRVVTPLVDSGLEYLAGDLDA